MVWSARFLVSLAGVVLCPVALAQQARLVMLGDSITLGWRVWGNLAQQAPHALDEGVSGNTSKMMLARLDADVLAHHPQVVVLLAGTNDTDIAAFENVSVDFSYMREIIERCGAAGARLIVGTIPPAPQVKWNEYALRWNAEVRLESKVYGYEVADYYPLFFVDGKKDDALFEGDLIHPSTAGFARMWTVLEPLLSQLLVGRPPRGGRRLDVIPP